MMNAGYASDAADVERNVMRKINWRIIPLLMICYIIAYIDRVNGGFAALQMNADIGLTAAMFGLGGTLFYAAYMIFEIPSNLAMQRFGARAWMARIMITWGFVGIAAAFVQGPAGFYITRFLLGAAEAGFYPGALYYVSQWYPMAYRARAVATFSVAVPLSLFLGGPLSGLLMELNGLAGLRGWQWLFIAESVPAIVLGGVLLLLLANRPGEARWLSADERVWLEQRLASEQQDKGHNGHMPLLKIITNKHVLLLALIFSGASATGNSLALWMPQIIKAFHLSNLETSLVTAIPYSVACVAMIYWGRRTDRTGERAWATAIPLLVTSASLALTNMTSSLVVTIILLSVALSANYAVKGPFWSLVGSYLSVQTAAAGFAIVNTLSHLGTSISASLIGVIRDRTGSFPIALLPLVALTAVSAATAVWISDGARKRRAAVVPARSKTDSSQSASQPQ